jgi:hypothetical protein
MIKISRITRKISIGIPLVKSLEEAVKVIIPNNYPAILSLFS